MEQEDPSMASMIAPAPNLSQLLATVPKGAWVAISHDGSRIIAFSAEMRDVIEQAREEHEQDPIVTRAPQSNSALIFES
jgi:hypothetical protein